MQHINIKKVTRITYLIKLGVDFSLIIFLKSLSDF